MDVQRARLLRGCCKFEVLMCSQHAQALIYDQGNGNVKWEECMNRVLEVSAALGTELRLAARVLNRALQQSNGSLAGQHAQAVHKLSR